MAPQVLLVEDNAATQVLLRSWLEFLGFTLLLAQNGEEALTQLETETPCVILLDLIMPSMDGYTLLEVVAQQPRLLVIPIIIITVGCPQKGLMLPPGLGFNVVSEKALAALQRARLPKSYWAWKEIIAANQGGFYPYTPATNLLYGLREAIAMLHEEGLPAVFARYARLAEATRRAVRAWGLEILCQNPGKYSNSLTAVVIPDGYNADEVRETILEHYGLSLGTGLGRLNGKVFRIGHLGDFKALSSGGEAQ